MRASERARALCRRMILGQFHGSNRYDCRIFHVLRTWLTGHARDFINLDTESIALINRALAFIEDGPMKEYERQAISLKRLILRLVCSTLYASECLTRAQTIDGIGLCCRRRVIVVCSVIRVNRYESRVWEQSTTLSSRFIRARWIFGSIHQPKSLDNWRWWTLATFSSTLSHASFWTMLGILKRVTKRRIFHVQSSGSILYVLFAYLNG
jgi:hypothetical protein